MGPYIKTLRGYTKRKYWSKNILSAIGTNSANYFKGLIIENETIFPGKFLSKHTVI